ncbi:MAG: DEAD/DEAH box helicase [Deltaproteobacteria bacterium]|nr:DEAD/DEAH box helicase [Deltaproteobacteria bacterium]
MTDVGSDETPAAAETSVAGFPPHLHPALQDALARRGFAEPTAVQRAVADESHGDRDLLVSSQTGSGKTVAFGLAASRALVAALGDKPRLRVERGQKPLVLVVAPTRELALQVQRELSWLYAPLGARVTSCVGGVDFQRERHTLDAGVHVVVGTPGRLVDHLTRTSLDLSALACVVLDEADEMLKMGFRDELDAILSACPPGPPAGTRRMLLFSATLPPDIVALAKKFQSDALRITATHTAAHQDIELQAHLVDLDEREAAVVNVLRFHDPARALVFVALRETVTRLCARLAERGFAAVALSGELSQAERNRALSSLREGRSRVLVCTDVAARGLDLPDVGLVIHADVAHDPVAMTHRNGRTGRAGRKGMAVILAIPAKQRAAELQLLAIGARTTWTPLPSAAAVRAADRARLTARVADDVALLDDDERSFGADLLAAWGPEQVAALLARTLRQSLPQPEDVERSLRIVPYQRGQRRQGGFAPRGRFGPDRGPARPRFDNPGDDHRGPARPRFDGPRADDRGPHRPRFDGPRDDHRGPPPRRQDDGRPPPRPRGDHRGPPRPRGDDRGPPRPRGDDRGPPRPRGDDRGPPPPGGDDRGPPPRRRDDAPRPVTGDGGHKPPKKPKKPRPG